MIKKTITICVLCLLVFSGCRSTSGKRVTKDITGINEQLYELEKNQIRDSNRIKKLEGQVGNKPNNSSEINSESKPVEKATDKEDSDKIYKDGYKSYEDNNYAEAIKLLSSLTDQFKDDNLVDNALYWQGESYMKLNQPEQALRCFHLIYRYFPFSKKADLALYKIGVIYADMSDFNRSILAFSRLIEEYPASELFKTASTRLKELKDKNKKEK